MSIAASFGGCPSTLLSIVTLTVEYLCNPMLQGDQSDADALEAGKRQDTTEIS